jgi:hypothetical protein
MLDYRDTGIQAPSSVGVDEQVDAWSQQVDEGGEARLPPLTPAQVEAARLTPPYLWQSRQLASGSPSHPLKETWVGMLWRCDNPKMLRYGGRGIRVCERWRRSFSAFASDMGPRPTRMHSIDRIDNDGGYTCGVCSDCVARGAAANCRWATRMEQTANRSVTHRIEHDGQSLTVAEWSRELGVRKSTIYGRLQRGGPVAEALARSTSSTPPKG